MDSGEGLAGRVVAITGVTSGIGREAAIELARRGATVVGTARDAGRGAEARGAIAGESGGEVHVLDLDLASFRSIHAFAAELQDRFDRLDVLVNNAGVILTERRLTREGFEETFGVNHLGHFLLTGLLADRLAATGRARVVNVASAAHRMAGAGALDDPLFEGRPYDGWQAYNASKLANVLFTRELARRLDGRGVTANCLHPGVVATGWGAGGDTSGLSRLALRAVRPFSIGPRRGARTITYLAASPEVEGRTGGYYVHGKLRPPSATARDPERARALWARSEELVAQGEATLA